MSKGQIAVIGAAGSQGSQAIDYLLNTSPSLQVLAVDREFSWVQRNHWSNGSVRCVSLDVVAEQEKLTELFADIDVVANFAGPFFKIGPAVMEAALRSRTHYIDICDDWDAMEQLMAQHTRAQEQGVIAVTGAGAAPGVTNLLVKMAAEYLHRQNPPGLALAAAGIKADICWCAPPRDLTAGIFEHMYHCFETAIAGLDEFPQWQQLQPRRVEFPEALGAVELVQLGHPEPYTLKRCLGIDANLWGGFTDAELTREAWRLCREVHQGRLASIADAWDQLSKSRWFNQADSTPYSGMVIDVQLQQRGIRFENQTTISMEQSTAVPAVAVALMVVSGQLQEAGVWSPEILDPTTFFTMASSVSPGGGQLECYATADGRKQEQISIRSLLAPVETGGSGREGEL
jgi:saccharopine dehydrogenase (NAD+, L-lysine-forming)